MKTPEISVIVPVWNEQKRIGACLVCLEETLNKLVQEWEIIVSDDGSSDGTVDEVKEACERTNRIRLVQAPHRGKGAAVCDGILAARGEWRFIADADLSMPAEELHKFLDDDVSEQYDIVIGSREMEGSERIDEPLWRHMVGRAYNRMVQTFIMGGIEDTQCGFKLFSKRAAEMIFPKLTIDGYGFDVEVLYLAKLSGLKIRELPIRWHHNGDSRVSLCGGLNGFGDIVRIRCNISSKRYKDEVYESPKDTTGSPSKVGGNGRPMKIAVVTPTFNERETLPRLVEDLRALEVDGLGIIVVDDGSPDGTGDLAEELARDFEGGFMVVHRPEKMGLRRAYTAGYRAALDAGAEMIVQMDADLSHPPEEVPRLLGLLEHADVAVGSRYVKGGGSEDEWGLLRRSISALGAAGITKILNLHVKDTTSGFKAFRASALSRVRFERLQLQGFGFQAELAYYCQRLGLSVVEHPYIFRQRAAGKSKMSVGIVVEALIRLTLLRMGF